MKELTKTEKFYVRAAIILFLLLIVKSVWIDEYNPVSQEEIMVYNEYMLEEVGNQNVLKYKRIIKIYEMEQEKVDKIEMELKYDYRIKVRIYLFGIIPYMEGSEYIYK
ncbi:MAG: hypothetical protein KAH05_05840 [Clostridiales bacterium]|nr:hypothetical protein [Clostridiales bacterium]